MITSPYRFKASTGGCKSGAIYDISAHVAILRLRIKHTAPYGSIQLFMAIRLFGWHSDYTRVVFR